MRQRYIEVGRDRANDLGRCLLVGGVGVGEQEAHRHRFDTVGHELAHGADDVLRQQWFDDLALGPDALADLEDAVARQQHLRRRREDVEHILAAPLPPDLVHVAEAARREQSRAYALAFEQRVERGGRAMQDQCHRIGAEVACEIRGDGLYHGGGLRRVGDIFAHGDELALIFVERGDIGKGPADIDADTQFHRAVFSPRSRAVAALSTARSASSATP